MSVRCDIWKGQSWALISNFKTGLSAFQGPKVFVNKERGMFWAFSDFYCPVTHCVRVLGLWLMLAVAFCCRSWWFDVEQALAHFTQTQGRLECWLSSLALEVLATPPHTHTLKSLWFSHGIHSGKDLEDVFNLVPIHWLHISWVRTL